MSFTPLQTFSGTQSTPITGSFLNGTVIQTPITPITGTFIPHQTLAATQCTPILGSFPRQTFAPTACTPITGTFLNGTFTPSEPYYMAHFCRNSKCNHSYNF